MVTQTIRRQRTRTAILSAATALMLREGAAGLRVDAVSNVAGVNKRMIYTHFGDREGLVSHVVDECVVVLLSSQKLSTETKRFLAAAFPRNAERISVADTDRATDTDTKQKTDEDALSADLVSYLSACRILLSQLMTREPAELAEFVGQNVDTLCRDLMGPVLGGGAHVVRKPRYRVAGGTRRIS